MSKVLITGATSGIGEHLGKHFAGQDWSVIACGRNQSKLNELTQEDDNIKGIAFDVTVPEQVKAAATQIKEPLDVLVLNAGNCEYIDDPMNFDSELFERVVKVNLLSLGYCVEHLLPKIKKGGQLVIVSSSASYLPFPRATAYGTTKAAANYFAKTLRIELKRYNIGVSLVCPGFVKTPLTDKNDFAMPMQVSANYAANAIFKGIIAKKQEIHFPTKFTLILKLLAALPERIWQRIAVSMVQPQSSQQ